MYFTVTLELPFGNDRVPMNNGKLNGILSLTIVRSRMTKNISIFVTLEQGRNVRRDRVPMNNGKKGDCITHYRSFQNDRKTKLPE